MAENKGVGHVHAYSTDMNLLSSVRLSPLMHPSTRPRTSKPRGLCQYYNTPRGCFAGDKCKFLHGEPPSEDSSLLTPYDRAKRCRFYAQGNFLSSNFKPLSSSSFSGFCKRGDACWFIHASESKSEDDEDELCSICFEKPTTYGLLGPIFASFTHLP